MMISKLIIFFIGFFLNLNCKSQDIEKQLDKLTNQFFSKRSVPLDTFGYKTILRSGNFSTSSSLSNKRTGTIDSERGELTIADFKIYYDIGYSAGLHMSYLSKKDCIWYVEKKSNNFKTCFGLVKECDKTKLIISIYNDEFTFPHSYPLNLWASIKDDSQTKIMLEITSTYKPNK